MPEYLAPGVFVEEVSFRQRTIEGVSTSTTGFVGPTRFGPVRGEPPILTSFADFERIYGGIDRLRFDGEDPSDNYLAHAVRAYFEEGGRRLYVARTYLPAGGGDGVARLDLGSPPSIQLRARHPGAAGDFDVTFVFRLGQNLLDTAVDPPALRGARNHDVVWAEPSAGPASPPEDSLFQVERTFDPDLGRDVFRLRRGDPDASPPAGERLSLDQVVSVRVLTVSVLVSPLGRFGDEQTWTDLTFDPERRRSLSQVFSATPDRRFTELYVPLVVAPPGAADGVTIAAELLAQPSLLQSGSPPAAAPVLDAIADPDAGDAARSFRVRLADGADGALPSLSAYEGDDDSAGKSGLLAFEDLEDISIVAAPGSTFRYSGTTDRGDRIVRSLISHCERMRYRVAVIDSADGQTPGEVLDTRGRIDSTRAAFYYPWVRVADPLSDPTDPTVPAEIFLPPSGFVAGIYARVDTERGVHKAPANEIIRLALGFELLINKGQQEVLNPEGVNCLRFFEGRGFRVWGARTASSDPEWKYLNVRRYFAYIERSVERGTQFAVFEPNGEALWTNVQQTVRDFLFNEWTSGRLLGSTPDEAFFVRCDRTTITQNDLDNGRLICLVGIAPLRPAEFVIFRIGQKTADARS